MIGTGWLMMEVVDGGSGYPDDGMMGVILAHRVSILQCTKGTLSV